MMLKFSFSLVLAVNGPETGKVTNIFNINGPIQNIGNMGGDRNTSLIGKGDDFCSRKYIIYLLNNETFITLFNLILLY